MSAYLLEFVMDAPRPDLPETIWYELPREYEKYLYLGMESFVSALLPFAMGVGEPIEVSGSPTPMANGSSALTNPPIPR